jgi:hypothetical protein
MGTEIIPKTKEIMPLQRPRYMCKNNFELDLKVGNLKMRTESSSLGQGPVAGTCNTTPTNDKVLQKARKIHGLAK